MTRIVNLTPHAITIPNLPISGMEERADWTLAPSGTIARVSEEFVSAPPIGDIPTDYVSYGAIVGLPDIAWVNLPNPCDEPGAVPDGSDQCLACGAIGCHVTGVPRAPAVYYVVSTITADAARRSGRMRDDLLVPGRLIRDESGQVIGCASLVRVR